MGNRYLIKRSPRKKTGVKVGINEQGMERYKTRGPLTYITNCE